jgi:hypothetical protein
MVALEHFVFAAVVAAVAGLTEELARTISPEIDES